MQKILTSSERNAGRTVINSLGSLLPNVLLKASLKFVAIAVFFCHSALADTLTIATASNFRPVLEQLSQAFSDQTSSKQSSYKQSSAKQSAYQIKISSGSSGVLYAQIVQGAPFQLFFSANESYPEKLVASGHGEADTLAAYAVGKLILVSRQEGISPEDMLSSAKRIAIANPRTAPYGIAAMEVMESLGVMEKSQPKLVVGNNIAQAWQFFHSGNADVAIVSASLVYSARWHEQIAGSIPDGKEEQQKFFNIDLSSHLKQPVQQSRVAIKPVSLLAQQFLDFIKTPAAQKVILEGGYVLPISVDTDIFTTSPMNTN